MNKKISFIDAYKDSEKYAFDATFKKFAFPIDKSHDLVLNLGEYQWDKVKDLAKTPDKRLKVFIIVE